METISNIIFGIKTPVILWEYNDRKKNLLTCKNYNNKIPKDDNVMISKNIIGKSIKDIYKFFDKKFIKHYKNCYSNKINVSYELFYNDNKISSELIYLYDDYIMEILNIVDMDNKINDDPFNMILILNENKIINVNFLFLKNTNYKKIDIINKNVNDIFINPINFNKENQIEVNNIKTKNNLILNVELYSNNINNTYSFIIMKDITLIKENSITNRVIKNLQTPIIVFNKDDIYFETYYCSYVNESFTNIFNFTESIINLRVSEIFPTHIYFKLHEYYDTILTKSNYIISDIEIGSKYYDFNCFIIENNLLGIILVDTTKLKETSNLQYIKKNFLEGILDKIEKPINGINNIINWLSETKLTIEQKEFTNTLTEYSYVLSLLLNDFTDYANLKLNKLKIDKEPFNLREEIDKSYDHLLIKSSEKNNDLTITIDSNVPAYIIGDKYRIKQIILILLGNAIKFTNDGKITLKIYATQLDNNNYELNFEVKDTGIGIDPKYHKLIFDSFYQIDNSHKNKGSGLGLNIGQKLCELMDGKLWVESDIGIGSTFYAKIKIEEYTDINRIENDIVNIVKDKSILIIDNNSNNKLEISNIVLKWKMKPYMASTYEEALFLIKLNKYDICIVDIDKNNINYDKLSKKLKKNNKSCLFVAMSIFDNINYNKDIFQYLIIKPINNKKLLNVFINLFADVNFQLKKKSSEGIQVINNLPILLLSKNHFISKSVINILSSLKYTNIEVVENNDIVIEKIMDNKYSLLLLDINNDDCSTIIKKIYKKINKKNISKPYIIGMISNNDNNYKKKYNKYGIDAYISKPIDKYELKALLKVISRRITI